MAELLIKAQGHWQDAWTKEQVSALTPQELQQYNARHQQGDIIVIRPDGWNWGSSECLPQFIVVQLPNVSVDTIKYMEGSLMDRTDPQNPIMLKCCKYQVPQAQVQSWVALGKSKLVPPNALLFQASIITKTS